MVSPFLVALTRKTRERETLVPALALVPAVAASYTLERPLPTPRNASVASPHMLFRQIIHEDLGCASYLVGDTASGVAAVVDPQWAIDPYLHLARLHGVRIEHVLETHNHADHLS